MYTKQVLKHFQNPHNQGKMKNPTTIGKAGNPICSDTMAIYIKLKDSSLIKNSQGSDLNKSVIEDIKFETLGCAAAIASSSVLTDLAKGKTLEKAMQITKEDVIKKLGGLPEHKIHCSLLAVDALKDAIKNLKIKK